MIRGVVTARYEAVIRIIVIGTTGQRESIHAIVDTGFDGWLSLPRSLINELEFPWHRRGLALLADGSESGFDIHKGTILWNRKRRRISIDACDTTPLVGMRLLDGYELLLPVRKQSRFLIRPISPE